MEFLRNGLFELTDETAVAITGVLVSIAFHGVGGKIFFSASKYRAVFDFKNIFSLALING